MADEISKKMNYSYNSFLVDFLLLAKRDPELKKIISGVYHTLDKKADHLGFGKANMPIEWLAQRDQTDIPEDSYVAEGITIKAVLAVPDHANMMRNVRALAAIAHLSKKAIDKEDDLLKLVTFVTRIQSQDVSEDIDKEWSDDATIRGLLHNMCIAEQKDDIQNVIKNIEKTKIGGIAREIAEELDLSSLDMEHPENWLDLASIGNPNSLLGGIVGKLGAKMTEKFKNGDIKPDDILADAMNTVKNLGLMSGGAGGMPDISALLGSLGGGGGGGSAAGGGIAELLSSLTGNVSSTGGGANIGNIMKHFTDAVNANKELKTGGSV
jgi:hypothetical protein